MTHATGTMKSTLLLVDDNPTNLQVLFQTLNPLGYTLLVAKDGEGAIDVAKKARPDLILLDIMMPPGIDGYETLKRLKDDPDTRDAAVIFLSALDDAKDKVKGLELGAVDFVTKPFQGEEVIARVNTHLTIQHLRRQVEARNAELAKELLVARENLKDARRRVEGPLLGTSSAVSQLRTAIAEAAAKTEPLLLVGPPGTGKEAVARAIHHDSDRGESAFIHAHCASMQSGSFTLFGASGTTPEAARFNLAAGGTLYMDGINRLPLDDQVRLLREIRDAENRNVRVIAAAGGDLEQDLQAGKIDADLYRLLMEHRIRVPMLLERKDDLPELAEHFAKHQAQLLGKPFDKLSPESLTLLAKHTWPDNIRELKSVVERAVTMATGPVVEIARGSLEGGRTIGSYRMVSKLGQGGMGEVWLAKHELLARPAAVKLIKMDVATQDRETMLERFQREARITANLHSPNTVELYDFGVAEDGAFYYVMERLFGLDLHRMVTDHGPISAGRVIHFLKQACRSLGEAHESGLVHRDIKPANLFACKMGPEFDFIKVLDFGMVKAKVGQDAAQLTGAGMATGTPAYMAPEVAMGEKDLDGRTDIYALGCVAFFLLTGLPVFDDENPTKILLQHVQEKPRKPSSLAEEDVPKALDQVVLKCLEKKPKDRPRSTEELWELLDGIKVKQEWDRTRAREWWGRHLPDVDAEGRNPGPNDATHVVTR